MEVSFTGKNTICLWQICVIAMEYFVTYSKIKLLYYILLVIGPFTKEDMANHNNATIEDVSENFQIKR